MSELTDTIRKDLAALPSVAFPVDVKAFAERVEKACKTLDLTDYSKPDAITLTFTITDRTREPAIETVSVRSTSAERFRALLGRAPQMKMLEAGVFAVANEAITGWLETLEAAISGENRTGGPTS